MTRLLFGIALMASFSSASNSLAEMPESSSSTSRLATKVSEPTVVVVHQPDGTIRLVDLAFPETDKRANVMQYPKAKIVQMFHGNRVGRP